LGQGRKEGEIQSKVMEEYTGVGACALQSHSQDGLGMRLCTPSPIRWANLCAEVSQQLAGLAGEAGGLTLPEAMLSKSDKTLLMVWAVVVLESYVYLCVYVCRCVCMCACMCMCMCVCMCVCVGVCVCVYVHVCVWVWVCVGVGGCVVSSCYLPPFAINIAGGFYVASKSNITHM